MRNATVYIGYKYLNSRNTLASMRYEGVFVDYMSEILKIIDGAVKANASMAANYASLLADKLEERGEDKSARLIRERLLRAPQALAGAQKSGGGISLNSLPIDGDSRLHTVDVSHPDLKFTKLHLPSGIASRINEFIINVQQYDEFLKADAALPNRLLVYGAPGTGKTKMARWIAAKLELTLLTVRCDTLISSLLGQTSRNLRQVFEYAQLSPCVLFLDEFDALAGARGNDRDIGELQRVVIALLQNIDALPEDTILIAATNHDSLLDPAIWRRFGFRIPMPLPDLKMRELMWSEMLGKMTPDSIDLHELAQKSDTITGAMIEQVSLDSRRDTVLSKNTFIDEIKLYRRLYLAFALVQGIKLSTTEQEIQWLRLKDKKKFSLRNLAGLYDFSTRTVSNILKEQNNNGQKESECLKS